MCLNFITASLRPKGQQLLSDNTCYQQTKHFNWKLALDRRLVNRRTDRQSLGCWPSALALNVSTRRMVECETITHRRWALIIGYERILKYISTFHGAATGSWIDCAESGLVIVKQLLHRLLHHGLEWKSSQISALTPPPSPPKLSQAGSYLPPVYQGY